MNSSRPINGPRIAVATLVVAGWLLIVLQDNTPGDSISGAMLIGLVFGTIFGQISLAATWCALGPFSLASRLPLSAGWIAALVLAIGWLIARDEPQGSGAIFVVLLFGSAFVTQWLLVQVPMWVGAAIYGLSIRHCVDERLCHKLSNQQFGIRQVMILTAIVAVVMGVGRILFGGASQQTVVTDWSGMAPFFVAATYHALIAFPLVAAALLKRRTAIGVLAALLLVALATFLEIPLLRLVERSGSSEPYETLSLLCLSGTQATWIVGIVFLLRLAGYELQATHRGDAGC